MVRIPHSQVYQKNKKILIIDTRSIEMPALWISYFTAGSTGLIVDQAPYDLVYMIELLQCDHGLLQLPDSPEKILHHTMVTAKLSPLALQLTELLFDSRLVPDLDPMLKDNLMILEKLLLEELETTHFNDLLPRLLEARWLKKRRDITSSLKHSNL